MNRKTTFFAALLFMLPGLLAAQERLSLADAVAKGLRNNYDILIAEEDIRLATRNNNWGEAGRMPLVSLGLTQNNSLRDVTNPASFLQGTTISNALTPSATLNWVLFDGFRVRATKQRFANLQKETEGNAEIVVQNTLQAIVLGYYAALFEQAQIEVLEKSLSVSRDKYDYTKLRKELGSAVTVEVLVEENNYLTDSINLITQRQVFRNALRNLNVLMAEENTEKTYELTGKLEHRPAIYTLDELMAKVGGNNVDIRRQFLSQAILRDNINLAKADLYPNIAFSATSSYELNRQDLSNAEFAFASPDRVLVTNAITTSVFAGFTLNYTLFNGGRIKRAIKNAATLYDIGNLQLNQLKLSINRDLAIALDLYNVRKQLKGVAERRREAAELNLELSLEQFKLGTINSFDYRLLQIAYLQAAFEDLQATFNLIDSDITLMRLTGSIVSEAKQ